MNVYKMKKISIVVIGIVCMVVGAGLYASYKVARLEEALVAEQFDTARIKKALVYSIQTKGATKTYNSIKQILMSEDSARQHSVAHMFGTLLYKNDGLQGIVVCDSNFGFGCFHSFFAAAILDKGHDIVSELDKMCVSSFGLMGLGCPHGIGHGLGEFFGPEKVSEQLSICEGLAWKGRFMGCRSGVFMEYNIPVATEGDTMSVNVRPFDPSNPYGICSSVSVQFQPACFLELTGWWEQVLEKDYVRIGELCQKVAVGHNQESCFLGVGYAVVQSHGYDIKNTIDICAVMPDEPSELLCRAGASWSFFSNPQYRAHASELCDSELCNEKANLLSYE